MPRTPVGSWSAALVGNELDLEWPTKMAPPSFSPSTAILCGVGRMSPALGPNVPRLAVKSGMTCLKKVWLPPGRTVSIGNCSSDHGAMVGGEVKAPHGAVHGGPNRNTFHANVSVAIKILGFVVPGLPGRPGLTGLPRGSPGLRQPAGLAAGEGTPLIHPAPEQLSANSEALASYRTLWYCKASQSQTGHGQPDRPCMCRNYCG